LTQGVRVKKKNFTTMNSASNRHGRKLKILAPRGGGSGFPEREKLTNLKKKTNRINTYEQNLRLENGRGGEKTGRKHKGTGIPEPKSGNGGSGQTRMKHTKKVK